MQLWPVWSLQLTVYNLGADSRYPESVGFRPHQTVDLLFPNEI